MIRRESALSSLVITGGTALVLIGMFEFITASVTHDNWLFTFSFLSVLLGVFAVGSAFIHFEFHYDPADRPLRKILDEAGLAELSAEADKALITMKHTRNVYHMRMTGFYEDQPGRWRFAFMGRPIW